MDIKRVWVLGALLLSGCMPPWVVVVQSGPPSALRGVAQISIESDFNALSISGRPIAEEMARRDPADQASLNEALAAMDASFRNEFASRVGVPVTDAVAPPAPGEVRLTVRYAHLDPGKYAVIYARDTDLTTQLVWSIGGQVVDEIEVRQTARARITTPAILQRVQTVGRATGQLGARFFRQAQQG